MSTYFEHLSEIRRSISHLNVNEEEEEDIPDGQYTVKYVEVENLVEK